MTAHETALAEVKRALEFYANEYRVEDSGNRARRTLSLLSALSSEPVTAAKADDLVEVVARVVFDHFGPDGGFDYPHSLYRDAYGKVALAVLTALDIPRREAEAAEREREACAQVADGMPSILPMSPKHVRGLRGGDVSAAIRSRSQPAAKAQGGGG